MMMMNARKKVKKSCWRGLSKEFYRSSDYQAYQQTISIPHLILRWRPAYSVVIESELAISHVAKGF